MKTRNSTFNFISILLLLFIQPVTVQFVNSQDFTSPVSYIEHMISEYETISRDLWNYAKAAAHSKNARKIENRREELINTILTSKRKIADMSDYEGNSTLRDSVVSYLHLSFLVLSEDYANIVDLEEIAEQSYDMMEAYLLAKEKANEKMDFASKMIAEEQKKFAGQYNITLIENKDKISKNLEIASEVTKHYNAIYLIFFKSYKQEAYLMQALGNNDINAIEQNRNTLLEFSKEGLEKLNVVKGYNNDISLKRACQQLLNFYVNEAKNKIPLITDFYLKKEKLEKIKNTIESKKQDERTKEDIDQYNSAVDDFNKSVNEYNQILKELNTSRNNNFDSWNKISQGFMDKHVP